MTLYWCQYVFLSGFIDILLELSQRSDQIYYEKAKLQKQEKTRMVVNILSRLHYCEEQDSLFKANYFPLKFFGMCLNCT